jgi:cytochrome oxidase assembly protein ShyY1
VLRVALTPRWLALHLLLVLAVGTMLWLGSWQWHRAVEASRPGPAPEDLAPVPVADVHRVGQTLPTELAGRRVVVAGRYDATEQVLVPDRDVGGRTGLWVVTPLVTVDGSGVLVVRGWVPSADDPAVAVPTEDVDVAGRLQPSETAQRGVAPGERLPEGQVAAVSTAALLREVPYPLYDGYVALVSQDPAAQPAPTPLPEQPPAARPAELRLQNYAYAVQWVLFAGFAVFLWWRALRDASRRASAPAEDPVASAS